MGDEPADRSPCDRWLTVEDVCKLLQVKPSWVYRHTSRGQMPHHKVGNLLRFQRAELDAWLAEHHIAVRRPASTVVDRLRRRRVG